jgi:hypothetical protein
MRSTFLQTLLTASSVVAVAQQQRHQEHEENILSARQAFREIHDHLLGLQLPGEVSQLKIGGNDQGLLEVSSRVNMTGWTELEDESTGIRKGNVKEDPEDRPRGKFQPDLLRWSSLLSTSRLGETSSNLTTSHFSSCVLAPISFPERTDRQTALTGRFLHITDFHPDPFYTAGSTFESGCHRKPEKKKKKKGKKGKNEVDGLKKDKDDDDDEDEELAGRWGTSSS